MHEKGIPSPLETEKLNIIGKKVHCERRIQVSGDLEQVVRPHIVDNLSVFQ